MTAIKDQLFESRRVRLLNFIHEQVYPLCTEPELHEAYREFEDRVKSISTDEGERSDKPPVIPPNVERALRLCANNGDSIARLEKWYIERNRCGDVAEAQFYFEDFTLSMYRLFSLLRVLAAEIEKDEHLSAIIRMALNLEPKGNDDG